MSTGIALIAGVGVGIVIGLLIGPASETSCCKRVSAAVRDEFRDEFGDTATNVVGATGLFERAPAILDWIGYQG